MTSKGERPSCRAQSSRVSWMRARVQKAAQGLATLVAIATAFTFTARAADYTVIDSTAALALGGATGGDEIRKFWNADGTYDLVHIFTTTGEVQNFTIPAQNTITNDFRLLVVGGGGSGYGNCGGGGGAGGVVTNTIAFPAGAYEVTVGAGGLSTAHEGASSAHNGAASVISNKIAQAAVVSALGGGHGGGYNKVAATSGGSGGGGGHRLTGALGTSDQGNAGGNSYTGNDYYGGGGGGAGTAGSNGTNGNGGAGGTGIELDITGEAVWYAGGGGGAGFNAKTGGTGGKGGGGAGGCASANGHNNVAKAGFDGEPGTGGGGGGGASGGGSTAFGGAGGSGIVVIRYTVTPKILDDGSLLYTYTSTNYVERLILPKAALTRILAVGGGGGGASGQAGGTVGGAGGGGAGGFVDTNNVILAGGEYGIYVGAGGAGGSGSVAGGTPAENGRDSAITNATMGVEVLRALGGGRGGVSTQAAGNGGSGGGGSRANNAGGLSTQQSVLGYGVGNAGGNGMGFNQSGAGGGGAGGPGDPVTAANAGSNGGAAAPSDITGESKPRWYAAGGGGGSRGDAAALSSGGAGGMGGDEVEYGGHGGYGDKSSKTEPTKGKDGTGSGGGGGCYGYAGAPGGSGIVIVRILRYMPDKPVNTNFTYTGAIFAAYAEDSYAEKAYTLEGTYEASAVGNYTFTATLKPGFCWGDGTTAPVVVNWQIQPKQLDISSFTMAGWQVGEAPSEPVLVSDPVVLASEVTHYYSASSSDWSAATTDKPTTEGTWFVKPVFDSTNFSTNGIAIPEASFTLWNWNADKYPTWAAYHAEITDTRYTGSTTLTNFPVLVRVNASLLPGFYAQCQADGSDVRFTWYDEATGTVTNLPFEVNVWDPDGESSWWVKVPEYAANSYVATINWGVILDTDEEKNSVERAMPENDPTEVWSDYIAVWHLDAGTESSLAETQRRRDATGHGYDLSLGEGGSVTTANSSVFGSSTYATGGSTANGALYSADYDVDYPDAASNFTYTAWYYAQGYNGNMNFAGKKPLIGTPDPGGWLLRLESGVSSTVRFITSSGGYYTMTGLPALNAHWDFFAVASSGTNFKFYANAAEKLNVTAAAEQIFGNGYPLVVMSRLMAADEVRVAAVQRSTDWIVAEYQQANLTGGAATGLTFGNVAVTPDVSLKNRWVSVPEMTVIQLEKGSDPSPYLNVGAAAHGLVTNVYTTLGGVVVEDMTSAAAGSYLVKVWVPAGSAGTRRWEGLAPVEFSFALIVSSPYHDLIGDSGTLTRSGRVLLVNDDSGFDPPVTDQSYWQTNSTELAYETYWTHGAEISDSSTFPYMMAGTVNTLQTTEGVDALCGATRLWHLDDVRIGNTYPSDLSTSSAKAFLPHSATAKAISSATGATGALAESAHLVMRNVEGAAVYSPCYTNGIGTIYFDAVNAWTAGAGDYYNLEVQIATNCVDGFGTPYDDWPTDENVMRVDTLPIVDDVSGETIGWYEETNYYAKANWQTVPVTPFKRDLVEFVDAAFHRLEATNRLALAVTNGGTVDNFYRVCAKIDYLGPVRFRIVRKSINPTYEGNPDMRGHILLDNLVVSYPAGRVNLSPMGHYDPSRIGDQTLGWAAAFSEPFPSPDEAIYARAVATTDGALAPDAQVSDLTLAATLHYRWRYLNQRFDPAEPDQWKTVVLDPANQFRAVSPLALPPGLPGDVEFWYSAILNAPYYEYVDYTGLALGAGDYSEAMVFVTNRLGSAATLESGGTDWFVRLRDGASSFADVTLQVGAYADDGETVAVTNEFPMAVVGNHIWRGYYPTATNKAGFVAFRLVAKDAQETWADAWDENETYFVEAKTNAVPVSSVLHVSDAEKDGYEWTKIPADAATGFLMFQFDDRTKSINVVHADYMNFNAWTDAKGSLFVGTTNDYSSAKMKGTSSQKRTDVEAFTGWQDMPMTNANWTVPSVAWSGFGSYTGGRKAYVPFKSDRSGAWDVGPGQWVAKNYRDDTTTTGGIALLMDGGGDGFISLTDSANAPRGVDCLDFNARLGQKVDFNAFNYCDIDGKATLTNYTFAARAAFDTNSNKDYRGNASMSLAAYYRPNVGCYEFRIEQYKGNDAGPTRRSQIFSLYRWNKSGSKFRETCLGSWTNGLNNTVYNLPNATSANGYYLPMFISVSNDVATATTVVLAGSLYTSTAGGNDANGIQPATALPSSESKSANYMKFCYKDASSQRLTSGTYGVLAANCPGVFLRPVKYANALPLKHTQANNVFKMVTFNVNNSQNYTTFTGATTDSIDQLTDNAGDMENLWGTGRMATFNGSSTQYGLRAGTNDTQELIVSMAPSGAASGEDSELWTELARVAVTNFGKVGSTANYHIDLYTPQTVALRVATGEDSDTAVVIDSFNVRQWAGADYQSLDDGKVIPRWTSLGDYRGHTNVVFTSCVVMNTNLLMSAKRTEPGKICSIRSPIYDGLYGRGLGLGMIAFEYANAQTNVNLLVQIATNVTYDAVTTTMQKGLDRWDEGLWTTVTNFNFAGADATTRAGGVKSVYVGMHGVQGALRIVMDPAVVEAVTNVTDATAFGEIMIKSVMVRDEPQLDQGCWWGWNLRTLGGDDDTEGRMMLGDAQRGLSLALNDAIDHDVVAEDAAAYRINQPFIQTPTFTQDIVGEICFKARMYGAGANAAGADGQWASVQLYGSPSGDTDVNASWVKLGKPFIVSNSLYTTYSYKTAQSEESYRAFRLAVTGVSGLDSGAYMPDGELVQPEGRHYELAETQAVRILLDEVLVMEAIRARVGFRNVGCFASRTDTQTSTVWANINDFNTVMVIDDANPHAAKVVQPLWREGWGVQCEIYKEQLPDEIDFDAMEPEVYLHWFKGTEPWGYVNWKDRAEAHVARLAPAADTNLVYRSSYAFEDGKSVVDQSMDAGEVVQFTLEVRYLATGASEPSSSLMASGEWQRPSWFAPVDFNAENPGQFAAFNILDSVAPGWAWINEVNLFGKYGKSYSNDEIDEQFVEVAAPADADMRGWKLYFLSTLDGGATIVTNRVANFGSKSSLPGKKTAGVSSGMVFYSLASPLSEAKLQSSYPADGTGGIVDGTWPRFDASGMTATTAFVQDGSLQHESPFGLQLVRPNGIVEHAIACVGTNYWAQYASYAATDSPTGIVANLSKSGVDFVWVGQDSGGSQLSLGVFDAFGETEDQWAMTNAPTPGRINVGQAISGMPPTPNGETLVVYASVDTSFGHILQTVGDAVKTNATQILYIRRGDTTNITYTLDKWYELGSVSTNDAPMAGLPAASGTDDKGGKVYVVPVGADISNNFTVVGTAKVADTLVNDFGLTAENRYTPAVMDWLLKGATTKGDFYNRDATEPLLADFLPLNNPNLPGTPMTLTEMYWLDIDPTLPWDADATKNARALKGGLSAAPTTVVKGIDRYGDEVDYGDDNFAMTNVRFGVKMMITNRNDGVVQAPDVLRGLTPGETSWNYSGNWTGATFQITGFLANGVKSFGDDDDWLPLRFFVFVPGSFDDNFESQIEVRDPYSVHSPGATYGWKAWVDAYGYTPIFYRWSLRDRGSLIGTETLTPTNYYGTTD